MNQPLNLKIVAGLYGLAGLLGVFNTVRDLLNTLNATLDLMIIFAIIAVGLMMHKAVWRKVANYVAVTFVIYYLIKILMFTGGAYNQTMTDFDKFMFWLTAAVILGSSAFSLWVLNTGEIRRRFEEKEKSGS